VLEHPNHRGMQRWVSDLNAVYRAEAALFGSDGEPDGFEWIDADDAAASVLSFVRSDPGARPVAVVANLTPVVRPDYRIGVPIPGEWEVLLNSDEERYWGSGSGTTGSVETDPVAMHGRDDSLSLILPPLGVLYLGPTGYSASAEPQQLAASDIDSTARARSSTRASTSPAAGPSEVPSTARTSDTSAS
jgi:1,4-alpha-glucan branching enzyme